MRRRRLYDSGKNELQSKLSSRSVGAKIMEAPKS